MTKTTPLASYHHTDKRANIPTEESRDFAANEELRDKAAKVNLLVFGSGV